MNLSTHLRQSLFARGADLVGFGDLTALDAAQTLGFPVGISVAVKMTPDIVSGIAEGPTAAYNEEYERLNARLDDLVSFGAELLTGLGFNAVAQTLAYVDAHSPEGFLSLLPHKTVATRARIGWIGKNALLVTEKYGSAVRLSSILTDAPLSCAKPIVGAKCGGCRRCARACPAGAVGTVSWKAGMPREMLLDAQKCRQMARARTKNTLGIERTLCGKCIEACPYTQRYIGEALETDRQTGSST